MSGFDADHFTLAVGEVTGVYIECLKCRDTNSGPQWVLATGWDVSLSAALGAARNHYDEYHQEEK